MVGLTEQLGEEVAVAGARRGVWTSRTPLTSPQVGGTSGRRGKENRGNDQPPENKALPVTPAHSAARLLHSRQPGGPWCQSTLSPSVAA